MITRNIEIVLYIDEKTHEARSQYLICENGEPKIKWKSEEAITCARVLINTAEDILKQTAGVLISAREKEESK